jgi:hypothetical protein
MTNFELKTAAIEQLSELYSNEHYKQMVDNTNIIINNHKGDILMDSFEFLDDEEMEFDDYLNLIDDEQLEISSEDFKKEFGLYATVETGNQFTLRGKRFNGVVFGTEHRYYKSFGNENYYIRMEVLVYDTIELVTDIYFEYIDDEDVREIWFDAVKDSKNVEYLASERKYKISNIIE